MIALREQRNVQNEVFCEERLGKNHALYAHLTYKDVHRFMRTDLKTNYDTEMNTSDVEKNQESS